MHSDRPAQLLLFEAERAWAQSQELKTQSNAQDQDSNLRKRGLGRARRAAQWAQDLCKLVDALGPRVDVQSRAETFAYHLITSGSAAFDKGDWQNSLEHLAVARQLLTALASSSSDSRGEALANSFVDAGEAQIRFCAYQLGEDEQDMDVVAKQYASADTCQRVCPPFDSLIAALEAKKAEQGAQEKERVQISWRGRTVAIRNPDLMDAVVRVRHQSTYLRDAIKADEASTGAAAEAAKEARVKGSKPARISHAERKARKRGQAAAASAGETSAAAVQRSMPSSRSGNDPYDHALAALTDGEIVARRLVDDNAEALSKSHSTRYEAVGQDLKVAHEWMEYHLLGLQIKRGTKLAEEVQQKATKREARKKQLLEKKLSAGTSSGKSTKKKRKQDGDAAAAAKQPKKPQPGSRAKGPRTAPRTHARRPARSGTKRLHAARSLARASRARVVSEAQSRRRSARAIPALAKLLDNAESNLIAISALSVIESDPDASSLVDAKAAWYRAELLRHLARAHAMADMRGEAALLLRRGALSVRQARQALELIEDQDVVQEVDAEIPPALTEDCLARTEAAIDETLRQTQREAFLVSRGWSPFSTAGSLVKAESSDAASSSSAAAASFARSKVGQQLQLLAGKHVDLNVDATRLREAAQPDPDFETELEDELAESLREQERGARKSTQAKPAAKAPAAAATAKPAAPTQVAPAQETAQDDAEEMEAAQVYEEDEEQQEEEEEDVGDTTEPYDPANQREEEEEREAEEQQQKKGGWLGGWFSRK